MECIPLIAYDSSAVASMQRNRRFVRATANRGLRFIITSSANSTALRSLAVACEMPTSLWIRTYLCGGGEEIVWL